MAFWEDCDVDADSTDIETCPECGEHSYWDGECEECGYEPDNADGVSADDNSEVK